MERDVLSQLIEWGKRMERKPLMINGVRQCGKTYILKEYGKRYFENTAYYNFEQNQKLASIFDFDFDVNRIIKELTVAAGGPKITEGKTLVIFDEIQACPKAITALKYFCESWPALHVACAGSLLGVALNHQNSSFPVGKVEHLQLYPLSFREFLCAEGLGETVQMVEDFDTTREIPEAFSVPLAKALKNYYIVGGMPEVVKRWVDTHDYKKMEVVQQNILMDYASDFAKHAPTQDIPKLGWIWDSIPKQLAKENNKFVFSHVKAGKRAAELEDALQWLVNAGLTYKLELVEQAELPLSFHANATHFKLYMVDSGLLRQKAGVSPKTMVEETALYTNFKGAFTENYVMTELLKQGMKPYFWRSGNTAELDFLIEKENQLIPIEAKAEINTKAKSFRLFCKKYLPQTGFICSMKNVGDNKVEQTQMFSLPLYMLWKINRYV
jgi:predicted AAA+ superfamily ATPase